MRISESATSLSSPPPPKSPRSSRPFLHLLGIPTSPCFRHNVCRSSGFQCCPEARLLGLLPPGMHLSSPIARFPRLPSCIAINAPSIALWTLTGIVYRTPRSLSLVLPVALASPFRSSSSSTRVFRSSPSMTSASALVRSLLRHHFHGSFQVMKMLT